MTAVLGAQPWMRETGPVDYYDPNHPVVRELLAEDAAARARAGAAPHGVTVDANGAHHGRGGLFVAKQLEYAHLQPKVEAAIEQIPASTVGVSYEAGAGKPVEFRVVTVGGRTRVVYPDSPDWHRLVRRRGRVGWELAGTQPAHQRPRARDGQAVPCMGTRANGTDCGMNTTWRDPEDRATPLCHHHGGAR